MNIFRLKGYNLPRGAIFLAAGLIAGLVQAQTHAQTQAPAPGAGRALPLSPPKKLQPTTPVIVPKKSPPGTARPLQSPLPLALPPALPPALPLARPPGLGGRVPGPVAIDVQSLGTIDPDSAGTLSLEKGGFGPNMWAGTKRALLVRLLPRLPAETNSRVMRALMRRLLLSTAKAPPPEGTTGSKQGPSLVALRVERLAAMGEVAAAGDQLRAAPGRGDDQALLRSETDILFLTNDNARACPLVAQQIRGKGGVFWQKAFVFCQSLAGEHERAALGLALLREQGVKDPVFFSLIEALEAGDKLTIESLPSPKPLHFAMVRAARARLPADVTSSNNPAVLRTVATSPNARPTLRIEAAERAEVMGALPARLLRELFVGVTLIAEMPANEDQPGAAAPGQLSRARMYREALGETLPLALATAVSRAFSKAREGGYYGSSARVYLPIIEGLAPSRELLSFAPEAVRASLAAGQPKAAENWLAALRQGAGFDPRVADELARLLPLVRLTGGAGPAAREPLDLAGWWALQIKPVDQDTPVNLEAAIKRAAVLFNLLEGLGHPVGAEHWAILLGGAPHSSTIMPGSGLWHSLGAAAGAGRLGETVLLSLLTLGQAGPGQANPLVLRRVIEGLRQVGLEADARKLAGEVAIAAGL